MAHGKDDTHRWSNGPHSFGWVDWGWGNFYRINWLIACFAAEVGGLGSHRLVSFNKALHGKWLRGERGGRAIIAEKDDILGGEWCSSVCHGSYATCSNLLWRLG